MDECVLQKAQGNVCVTHNIGTGLTQRARLAVARRPWLRVGMSGSTSLGGMSKPVISPVSTSLHVIKEAEP